MNIYVGNLSYKVRENDLQGVIEEYGAVDSCKIIKDRETGKSKGFAFVEMADDASLKGLPAGLRMNAIASHGGTTKANFEAFSLAASIVGKCHFCVKAHYDTLKKEGYTVEQLRDIGRIASVMNSVAKVLNS